MILKKLLVKEEKEQRTITTEKQYKKTGIKSMYIKAFNNNESILHMYGASRTVLVHVIRIVQTHTLPLSPSVAILRDQPVQVHLVTPLFYQLLPLIFCLPDPEVVLVVKEG